MISRSSVAERRLDKPQAGARGLCPRSPKVERNVQRAMRVAGSHPREPGSSRCGADGSARDLGSRGRRFETCHRDQTTRALGCGRSSMAEPWAVNPLVPVRLRPVTPKRMHLEASRTRAAENRALTPDGQGSSPWRRTTHQPLVAESADAPVSETGARRACPFDSDRGDQPAVR